MFLISCNSVSYSLIILILLCTSCSQFFKLGAFFMWCDVSAYSHWSLLVGITRESSSSVVITMGVWQSGMSSLLSSLRVLWCHMVRKCLPTFVIILWSLWLWCWSDVWLFWPVFLWWMYYVVGKRFSETVTNFHSQDQSIYLLHCLANWCDEYSSESPLRQLLCRDPLKPFAYNFSMSLIDT